MAHTVARTEVPFGALATHRIVTAFSDAIAEFRHWNQTRRTVAELRRLSPRQLDDIGLSPADVQKLAHGSF